MALTAVVAALMVPAGAHADASTYDLNPLLTESHPFAPAPYFQTAREPAAVTKPATEDTLVGLFGLATPSESPPMQAASALQVAAVPQQASVGLTPPHNGDPSFITISGGWYDFNDNEQAVELTAEWRSGTMFWIFKPFAGAMVTTDAGLYGFGGILTDFYFGRRIVVTPSIAAGLYADGDGKDLGSIIEFRSGLEVGWRFNNRARLSAMVYHISNASIGSSNPGTEIFSIGYSFPLR